MKGNGGGNDSMTMSCSLITGLRRHDAWYKRSNIFRYGTLAFEFSLVRYLDSHLGPKRKEAIWKNYYKWPPFKISLLICLIIE